MKPAAKRTISLLVSVAFLIVALSVYGLFISPVYDDVVVLRGELSSRDQFLQKQSYVLGKVDSLVSQFHGVSELQKTVSLSLPLDEDLSSIFNQLRVLASVNNLVVEVFGVKPMAFRELAAAPLAGRVGALQLSLRVSGPYEGFKNFLKNLETNVRVMDVESIAIERTGGLGTNYFTYNLVVNTYYQEKLWQSF